MEHQCIDQGPGVMTYPRVHHHASLLIDNYKFVVFVHQIQGYLFGEDLCLPGRMGQEETYNVTRFYPVVGFCRELVHGYVPGLCGGLPNRRDRLAGGGRTRQGRTEQEDREKAAASRRGNLRRAVVATTGTIPARIQREEKDGVTMGKQERFKYPGTRDAMDGNTAAIMCERESTDGAGAYPITPSTQMGEYWAENAAKDMSTFPDGR